MVGGQRHGPAAFHPGKTRYPLYRRLGGHQGRSGRVWKNSPPPGFDPRTVQPVASLYTDWAIPGPQDEKNGISKMRTKSVKTKHVKLKYHLCGQSSKPRVWLNSSLLARAGKPIYIEEDTIPSVQT
jgi:hypothetical protein